MAPQKNKSPRKYIKRNPVNPFENPYKREYKGDKPYGYLKIPHMEPDVLVKSENVIVQSIESPPLETDFDVLVSRANNFNVYQFPSIGKEVSWMCPPLAVQKALNDLKNVENALNNPQRFESFLDCLIDLAQKSSSVAKISTEYFS